jgi:cytochrome c oxidase accessory protein FixG
MLFYGFATYGNAGYMREQVCKYMCPYARFQSAMFDKDTLVISYDTERGEPRGAKREKKGQPRLEGVGDCIDCNLCVQVCPTGIDIRNGLQYACIGCAACIDVCNGVMDKVGYARGLIRYDTENGMAQHLSRAAHWRRVFRPRVLIYGTVLLLVSAALVVSLYLRHPFKADVVRDRATLARIVDDGYVENIYRVQLMNASEAAQRFSISAQGLPGLAVVPAVHGVEVGPAEGRWIALALRLPPGGAISPGAHPVQLKIEREGGEAILEKTTFVLPR